MACQSCESCNICDGCEYCDTECNGTSGCLVLQTFCSTNQYVGGFSFNGCIASGQFIISAIDWNRLVYYVQEAYSRGAQSYGGTPRSSTVSSGQLVTAKIFNDMAADLYGLGTSGTPRSVTAEVTLIHGSYFAELESAANNLRYLDSQCDTCNTTCNVPCNACQGCDVCQGTNYSYNCCEVETEPETEGTT